jgi:hypothetical protein
MFVLSSQCVVFADTSLGAMVAAAAARGYSGSASGGSSGSGTSGGTSYGGTSSAAAIIAARNNAGTGFQSVRAYAAQNPALTNMVKAASAGGVASIQTNYGAFSTGSAATGLGAQAARLVNSYMQAQDTYFQRAAATINTVASMTTAQRNQLMNQVAFRDIWAFQEERTNKDASGNPVWLPATSAFSGLLEQLPTGVESPFGPPAQETGATYISPASGYTWDDVLSAANQWMGQNYQALNCGPIWWQVDSMIRGLEAMQIIRVVDESEMGVIATGAVPARDGSSAGASGSQAAVYGRDTSAWQQTSPYNIFGYPVSGDKSPFGKPEVTGAGIPGAIRVNPDIPLDVIQNAYGKLAQSHGFGAVNCVSGDEIYADIMKDLRAMGYIDY